MTKLTDCLMGIQIPMIWAQSLVGIVTDNSVKCLHNGDPVVIPPSCFESDTNRKAESLLDLYNV